MVETLCGDDAQKWNETLEIAKQALHHRLELWSHIHESILRNKKIAISH